MEVLAGDDFATLPLAIKEQLWNEAKAAERGL
jgi:hypothetical protein